MLIDTLTIAQNLTAAGIPDAHAKAIAKEYAHLMQHQIDQFATKEDIKLLRNELQRDLQHVEERLETKIDQLETKVEIKIDNMVWRMTVNSWGVGATVVGLLFAALKLFN